MCWITSRFFRVNAPVNLLIDISVSGIIEYDKPMI